MVEFTKSLKFIISFLFLILLLSMFTNNKVTYSFLVLILLSMAMLNSEKIKKLMEGLRYE